MEENLRIIWEIVKKEFYQIRQDRRMLGISVAAPILQVLLLGYAATTDIRYSNMVICDEDRTEESRALIRRFTNVGVFHPAGECQRARCHRQVSGERKGSIALLIPRDFGSKVLARTTVQVQVILDGADANSANVLLSYATQIINSHSQALQAGVVPAFGRRSVGIVAPEPRVWFNPDLLSSNFMVPGSLPWCS